MFIKATLSVALALSAAGLATASAETVYVGGPKGGFTTRAASPSVQVDNAYAQSLPSPRRVPVAHIYQGGPKSTVPHVLSR